MYSLRAIVIQWLTGTLSGVSSALPIFFLASLYFTVLFLWHYDYCFTLDTEFHFTSQFQCFQYIRGIGVSRYFRIKTPLHVFAVFHVYIIPARQLPHNGFNIRTPEIKPVIGPRNHFIGVYTIGYFYFTARIKSRLLT